MDFIKKYIIPLKQFLVLWLGQSISQLGSTMTVFAVTIWAFEKTGSALVLSISGSLIMIPRMLVSIIAGPFVDRMNKKYVMILADIGAGLCTLVLFLLLRYDALEIWHIYLINTASSTFNSFQSPASNVAISAIVPKEFYVKIGGLLSLSGGVVQIIAPILAAMLLSTIGITGVVLFDFATMAFACVTLSFIVKIPIARAAEKTYFNLRRYYCELSQGVKVIRRSILLRKLVLFMLLVNFFAGIAYYTLLSPMILARTASDTQALAYVNGAVGLGSIVGALLVLLVPSGRRKTRTMFLCCALSFLLGDVLLSIGNTIYLWVLAGFFASVFLPMYGANEGYFWRTIIPLELQGRAFSLKYALQSGIIPIGMLIGGLLADHVFEPLMTDYGNGAGMALMFFITGLLGAGYCFISAFNRTIQDAEAEVDSMPNQK